MARSDCAAVNLVDAGEWGEMSRLLIDDWRRAWRFFSLWFMAAAMCVQVAWNSLPVSMKDVLPPDTQRDVTIGLLIAGAMSRVMKQSKGLPPQ